MDSRSVSRCIAIAAHGRRCQQTPFRGGPYCWHHTQSRKMWRPSRTGPAGAGIADREPATHVLAQVNQPRGLDAHTVAALTAALGADVAQALAAFAADDADASMTLRRRRGRVTTLAAPVALHRAAG